MQLHFEKWIKEQSISPRTEELVDEALTCYRGKAYKASLLFTFLTFQNILKERMLYANKPPGYTEKFWGDIQNDLRDDDQWESKVIECVNRNKPASIFNLNDDTKNQYFYWKDRRNDCAHAKGNKINYSHVETFWLFIESNLGKFGVSGGKVALLERLHIFFDSNLTPRDADPMDIISDIPLSVEQSEYAEVIDTIHNMTVNNGYVMDSRLAFWQQLFLLGGDFEEALIDFLRINPKLCLEILEDDPSKVHVFSNHPEFIRSLWKEHIYNTFKYYKIIIGLLRHRLVPTDQLKELVDTVTEKVNDTWFINAEEFDIITLDETGFLDEFKELAFSEMKINDFDWARENRNLIVRYLLRRGLDEEIVRAINSAFSGMYTPWKLGDSLKELLDQKDNLKQDYIRINNEIQGNLPKELFNSCAT